MSDFDNRQQRRFLSRQQAAEYLGIATQTLALWAHTGRYGIPYTKVGRKASYSQNDLDAWLASRTGTNPRQIELASA